MLAVIKTTSGHWQHRRCQGGESNMLTTRRQHIHICIIAHQAI